MSNVNNAPVYWFIFFNDQLLLKKEGETYTIPCSIDPPVPVENVLEVCSFRDVPCRTAAVGIPLEETAGFVPMGLRASYDARNPIGTKPRVSYRWDYGHRTIISMERCIL